MSSGSALSRGLSRLSRRRKKKREMSEDLPDIEEERVSVPSVPAPPTPSSMPLHLAQDEHKPSLLGRSMDRLRRSIRQSFRRKRSSERLPAELVSSAREGSPSKSEAWQPDESAVRAGLCSFQVKYLGAVEVFESRGMQVCEGALKLLRSQQRRPVKAVLYVSGDGLRVVDQQNNRGLLVDQTIEKVSFCAPDRNNDRGFAYICRDGTSRRWMCHGFHAQKESGERLSHAVGCAFAVCLERKKKRDEESTQATAALAERALNPNWGDQAATTAAPASTDPTPTASFAHANVSPSVAEPAGSFQRNHAYESFRRHVPIGERLADPQQSILAAPPAVAASNGLDSIARGRPKGNHDLFKRQGSLRAPDPVPTGNFRRQLSLRTGSVEGASSLVSPSKQFAASSSMYNEPIYETEEDLLGGFAPPPTTTAPSYPAPAAPSVSSYQAPQPFIGSPLGPAPSIPPQPAAAALPPSASFSAIPSFQGNQFACPFDTPPQLQSPVEGRALPGAGLASRPNGAMQNGHAADWAQFGSTTSSGYSSSGIPPSQSHPQQLHSLNEQNDWSSEQGRCSAASHRSKADEWLADVMRGTSNAASTPADKLSPRSVATPSPLESVRWERAPPVVPPRPVMDPFDVRWSKKEPSPLPPSNPFQWEGESQVNV